MANRDLDQLRIGDAREPDPAVPRTVRGSVPWRTLVSRAVAPALAWFALGLVLFGATRELDYDLQLVAASAAAPGALLPVRARFYDNLRALEGPRLVARPIELRLEDRSGHVYARTWLAPAHAGLSDIEGSLRIPAGLHGAYRLHGRTQADSLAVEVWTQLQIGEPERMPAEGRPLRALQQFSEGPVQSAAQGASVPDALRVRVAGGACVPEEECRLFVHVGEPAAAVWIEGNSTLTPDPAAARPSAETAGIVALSVVTHGPEAQLWLRAERAGAAVARRALRLPVALAASQLYLRQPLTAAPANPELVLLGGEGGCIVDIFRDGHWLFTASAASCSGASPPSAAANRAAQPSSDTARRTGAAASWPVRAALPPGVYRVQARRDPFASSTAGVALLYVFAPAESPSAALRELARRVLAVESDDRFARSLMASGAPQAAHAASFGYLAAALESGVIELPRAVSGYAATLERLAQSQAKLRWLSIAALALGGASLALVVGRTGLRAALRADALLLDAGHSPAVRRRARLRGMLSLVLSVLSLILVFVVLGAYVVARSAP